MKTAKHTDTYRFITALFFLFFGLFFARPCMAEVIYENPDTSYKVCIEDEADLLTDEEEKLLGAQMEEITAYGNAAFVSLDSNYTSTESYAKEHYRQLFGSDSGTMFMIDMYNRNIWIHSNGSIYRTITNSYADTITDNVYTYASDQDYYGCASEAYTQIATLLAGRRIAQPMKYISNALLALIAALLINYFIVRTFSRSRKASENEILENIYTQCSVEHPQSSFIRQKKTYSPPSSSDSSSGDSSGGGSSGGGGGSSSGGGGGHSF